MTVPKPRPSISSSARAPRRSRSVPPRLFTATPSELRELIEALATILSLKENLLPANAGVTEVDSTLNLDIILNAPRQSLQQVALTNSLAFGGLNAVLALRRL